MSVSRRSRSALVPRRAAGVGAVQRRAPQGASGQESGGPGTAGGFDGAGEVAGRDSLREDDPGRRRPRRCARPGLRSPRRSPSAVRDLALVDRRLRGGEFACGLHDRIVQMEGTAASSSAVGRATGSRTEARPASRHHSHEAVRSATRRSRRSSRRQMTELRPAGAFRGGARTSAASSSPGVVDGAAGGWSRVRRRRGSAHTTRQDPGASHLVVSVVAVQEQSGGEGTQSAGDGEFEVAEPGVVDGLAGHAGALGHHGAQAESRWSAATMAKVPEARARYAGATEPPARVRGWWRSGHLCLLAGGRSSAISSPVGLRVVPDPRRCPSGWCVRLRHRGRKRAVGARCGRRGRCPGPA